MEESEKQKVFSEAGVQLYKPVTTKTKKELKGRFTVSWFVVCFLILCFICFF